MEMEAQKLKFDGKDGMTHFNLISNLSTSNAQTFKLVYWFTRLTRIIVIFLIYYNYYKDVPPLVNRRILTQVKEAEGLNMIGKISNFNSPNTHDIHKMKIFKKLLVKATKTSFMNGNKSGNGKTTNVNQRRNIGQTITCRVSIALSASMVPVTHQSNLGEGTSNYEPARKVNRKNKCAIVGTTLQPGLDSIELETEAKCKTLPVMATTTFVKPKATSRTMPTHRSLMYFLIVAGWTLLLLASSIYSRFVETTDRRQKLSAITEALPVVGTGGKLCKNAEDDGLTPIINRIDPRHWKPTNTHLNIYTVPRFPENYNSLLPLSLQQRLDEMSPREYLTYVLNELTLEERESLMVDERQRRKTFLATWPFNHTSNLSGIKMAQAGLYCLDDYDRVQCVFCRGSLHHWRPDDIPMTEHAISFSFCKFAKGIPCGNREYRASKLTSEDMCNITKFLNTPTNHQQRDEDSVADSLALGISTNRADMIRYAPRASRLKTFSRWSTTNPVSSQKLCDAGFYYTGFDDQVRCFFCGGGIKDWLHTDNPWEEHARWFPDCAYLIHNKGQDYVEEVRSHIPENKKSVRKTLQQNQTEIKQLKDHTEQEHMRTICQGLGYSLRVIDKVISLHGKPFENIRKFLTAIDAYELLDTESEDNEDERTTPVTPNQTVQNEAPACPEDERRNLLQQDETDNYQPGRFDGTEHRQKFKMGCRHCELKTNSFVPATHVGLPCGHLIYCDGCNAEEMRKCEGSGHSARCPYPGCGAPTAATIKVYLA